MLVNMYTLPNMHISESGYKHAKTLKYQFEIKGNYKFSDTCFSYDFDPWSSYQVLL